jgi:hypothetical protein
MGFVPLSSNHIATGSGLAGYGFGGPDDVQVDPGIIVLSTQGDGVDSKLVGGNLDNFGQIFSAFNAGIFFLGGTSDLIINEAAGQVTGEHYGLLVIGSSSVIVRNFGGVIGLVDGVTFALSGTDSLYNYGSIFGDAKGLSCGDDAGDTISNAGKIASNLIGIAVQNNPGPVTSITNLAGGIIAGGQDAVENAGFGAIHFNNLGTTSGNIACTGVARAPPPRR